MTVITKQ